MSLVTCHSPSHATHHRLSAMGSRASLLTIHEAPPDLPPKLWSNRCRNSASFLDSCVFSRGAAPFDLASGLPPSPLLTPPCKASLALLASSSFFSKRAFLAPSSLKGSCKGGGAAAGSSSSALATAPCACSTPPSTGCPSTISLTFLRFRRFFSCKGGSACCASSLVSAAWPSCEACRAWSGLQARVAGGLDFGRAFGRSSAAARA
mmetsp:Transcript_35733/g.83668  ORF Transcript_35733/g.83668 Transcript_35733/m.83668 type:complete len:206 (+) Transcript_35733:52-669(+)